MHSACRLSLLYIPSAQLCVCVRVLVHVWCVCVVYYTLELAMNKRHALYILFKDFNAHTHTHTYHYFFLLQCHSSHGHELGCHRQGAVVDLEQCPLNLTGCPNAHGDVNDSSALTIDTSGDGLCECTSNNSSERLCGGCSPSSKAVVSCAVLVKFTAAFNLFVGMSVYMYWVVVLSFAGMHFVAWHSHSQTH